MKTMVMLLLLATLAACGQTPSVAYFKANEEDRDAVIEKCDNDPAHLEYYAACINARAARAQLDHERNMTNKNKSNAQI